MASFESANFVRPTDKIGGIGGGGLDSIDRFHTPLHHFRELPGVIAMRVHTSVGSERHLCPALPGVSKIFALEAADFFLFFDGLRKHPDLGAFLKYEIIVVYIEDEIGAVLF